MKRSPIWPSILPSGEGLIGWPRLQHQRTSPDPEHSLTHLAHHFHRSTQGGSALIAVSPLDGEEIPRGNITNRVEVTILPQGFYIATIVRLAMIPGLRSTRDQVDHPHCGEAALVMMPLPTSNKLLTQSWGR